MEILFLVDFNVHHREWFKSSLKDGGEVEVLRVSILNVLGQIINNPNHIPNHQSYSSNTLDLSFSSNPLHYSYIISLLNILSNHTPVNVSSHLLIQLPLLNINIGTLILLTGPTYKNYFLIFLEYYCLSLSVLLSLLRVKLRLLLREAFITSSPKIIFSSNLWSNNSCTEAIQAKNHTYWTWKNSPSFDSHLAFIST